MYTCIAIDDEFATLEIITDYIAEHPDLKLLNTYNNPLVALEEISNYTTPVDIIFMDIEMPEMNGLELSKLIRHQTKKLVFVTAHSRYAINSYELGADAFLLKPVCITKFNQTVSQLFSSPITVNEQQKDYILLKSTEQRNQLIKIQILDIIAVEAQERSIKVVTEKQVFYSNSSFAEVLQMLEKERGFSQIHRSFIIAEKRIKILERTLVVLDNNLKVSIGRKYSEFYHKMLLKVKDQH